MIIPVVPPSGRGQSAVGYKKVKKDLKVQHNLFIPHSGAVLIQTEPSGDMSVVSVSGFNQGLTAIVPIPGGQYFAEEADAVDAGWPQVVSGDLRFGRSGTFPDTSGKVPTANNKKFSWASQNAINTNTW